MKMKSILFISLLLFINNYSFAQDCNCESDDYREWNQGGMVFESGEVNMLDSSNIIIKDKLKTNSENMLAVSSKVNKYHSGYHFYFDAYIHNKASLPKEIGIKLINNKGLPISYKGTKVAGQKSEYNVFVSQKDTSFKDFINVGFITKIELFDYNSDNKVLAKYYLSDNESLDIKKIFCCAIKLKKEVIGEED